jgi:hypothetical protein
VDRFATTAERALRTALLFLPLAMHAV